MEHLSDVTVIGGGPSGSFTALNLAKHGITVKIFEEHNEIGAPSHCAGHVGIRGLTWLKLFPLPRDIIENIVYGAVFYSPKGEEFSVRSPSPITIVIDRALFDKHIAEKAKKEGVKYCLKSKVKSLILEDNFAKGVVLQNGQKHY